MTGRIVWFAGSSEIARLGPFASEVEAWRALRLSPKASAAAGGRVHAPGAYVWPEFERK